MKVTVSAYPSKIFEGHVEWVSGSLNPQSRTAQVKCGIANASRELTEALKRRCLYLWLDYPEVEREIEIVRLHSPEIDEQLARRLVEVVHMAGLSKKVARMRPIGVIKG